MADSVQTEYSLTQKQGYPGLLYDGFNPKEIISRACETAGGIPFGTIVSFGTDKEKQCVLGGDDTGIGVSTRNSKMNPINSTDVEYDQYDSVGILRDGMIWVTVATAAVAGTALKYDDTTGVIDTGAAGAGETALSTCELLTTVANDGDLGLIRVKL